MPHSYFSFSGAVRPDWPHISREIQNHRYPCIVRELGHGRLVFARPLTLMIFPGDHWVTVSSPFLDLHASAPTRELAEELWCETVMAFYAKWSRRAPEEIPARDAVFFGRLQGLLG